MVNTCTAKIFSKTFDDVFSGVFGLAPNYDSPSNTVFNGVFPHMKLVWTNKKVDNTDKVFLNVLGRSFLDVWTEKI